jgi:hypothetical protein
VRGLHKKCPGSLFDELCLGGNHCAKINRGILEVRLCLQIRGRETSLRNQRLKIYEQRISRDAGAGLVWRIAVAGRAQRKDLPVLLPAICEEVGKAVCRWTQIPDSPLAGKRCGVEQDSAFAHGSLHPGKSAVVFRIRHS